MSKGNVEFKKCDEYYTPKEIVDSFGGGFEYDPFTTIDRAKYLGIPNFDTKETDGFKRDWSSFKKIWINPPFSMKKQVVDKICEYKDKCEIYLLVPIETLCTKYISKLEPYDLYLFNGRIKFITQESLVAKSPAFGSVVIKTNGTNKIINKQLNI